MIKYFLNKWLVIFILSCATYAECGFKESAFNTVMTIINFKKDGTDVIGNTKPETKSAMPHDSSNANTSEKTPTMPVVLKYNYRDYGSCSAWARRT